MPHSEYVENLINMGAQASGRAAVDALKAAKEHVRDRKGENLSSGEASELCALEEAIHNADVVMALAKRAYSTAAATEAEKRLTRLTACQDAMGFGEDTHTAVVASLDAPEPAPAPVRPAAPARPPVPPVVKPQAPAAAAPVARPAVPAPRPIPAPRVPQRPAAPAPAQQARAAGGGLGSLKKAPAEQRAAEPAAQVEQPKPAPDPDKGFWRNGLYFTANTVMYPDGTIKPRPPKMDPEDETYGF